ncbi:MAG: exostosin family protein [bacterium]|nr:exostosin family protein [bacterium]
MKAYIGELLPNVLPFPILNSHLGKEKYRGEKAYRAIFDEMDFSFISLTQNPEDADFFLFPHNYFSIKDTTYINHFIQNAEKHGKQVLVFAFGDREIDIGIENATILRYSGYRYKGIKDNEVIIPTQIYAGDILKDGLFFYRDKKEIPTISFCGWAGFSSWRERLGHFRKTVPLDFKKYILLDKNAEVHKQGVHWRKKAIKALTNSPHIQTSFVIRNFYAANKNTIQGDPAVLRKEYVENIQHSDFVLVARGDSNMATRFYETLALGRIPVLIDTDWMLPLEDVIDYKKFVVFVPYRDIKNTDKYIKEFWDKIGNAEFQALQKEARETFMKYFKFDSFLKYLLENFKDN